jgi:opacity protein-like surface antigen
MGGSGTFGLRMSMNYSSLNLEIAGEQVIGKTANLYPLSVNVLLNLATRGRLIPYGAVGAGLMLTTPTNSIGDETVTTLGLNFGGGARYYITRSFGVRLEAKQYVTSVHSERESNSELLFFQEVSLGVTFMLR